MHRTRGQASAEYVAVVAVIALVLTGAATAIADPAIPRGVVRAIRTGLCVVAGDICRPQDARARGLDPCVVSSWDRTRSAGVTALLAHLGTRDTWTVLRRSDGTRLLSFAPGVGVKGTVGVGLKLGPHVRIGLNGSAGFDFTAGKAWELPDEPALQAMIRRIDAHHRKAVLPWSTPQAPIRFTEGGFPVDAGVELGAGERGPAVGDAEFGAGRAIGRRTGPGGTTWYLDTRGRAGGDLADLVPALRGEGEVLAEWHTSPPRSLTLRTTTTTSERTIETTARLPLDRIDDARLVALWAANAAAPGLAKATATALGRRLAARGTVQRLTYEERTEEGGWDASAQVLGVGIGADRKTVLVRRRLVDAEVIGHGRSATRFDCLGLDAA